MIMYEIHTLCEKLTQLQDRLEWAKEGNHKNIEKMLLIGYDKLLLKLYTEEEKLKTTPDNFLLYRQWIRQYKNDTKGEGL